jgi:outer membrane protein OmpA-like peptidoglycan-associated protein
MGNPEADHRLRLTGRPTGPSRLAILSDRRTGRSPLRRWLASLSAAVLLLGIAGCQALNRTQTGAIIGAGSGAVIGGAIAKGAGGSTVTGAIIGAAVGGTAGAIIGRQMDRQAEELERELEGAQITRVGEGIEILFDSGILFGFDSTELTPEARANLAKLAQSLQQYPETEVTFIGHTDAIGSAQYNQGLSERRARAAASLMTASGIGAERIQSIGRGLHDPVATNDHRLPGDDTFAIHRDDVHVYEGHGGCARCGTRRGRRGWRGGGLCGDERRSAGEQGAGDKCDAHEWRRAMRDREWTRLR